MYRAFTRVKTDDGNFPRREFTVIQLRKIIIIIIMVREPSNLDNVKFELPVNVSNYSRSNNYWIFESSSLNRNWF